MPNGVDILFKPPCKFQPCKMAKGDPWSPTMLLTMNILNARAKLFIYVFS